MEAVEPEVKTCEQEVSRPEDPAEDAGPSQQGQESTVVDEVKKQEPELQPEDTTSQSASFTSEQEVLQSVAKTARGIGRERERLNRERIQKQGEQRGKWRIARKESLRKAPKEKR